MSARPVVKTSFMDAPMQEAAIMAAQVGAAVGGRTCVAALLPELYVVLGFDAWHD